MVLIFALARREDARNVGRLLEIDPQPAHGVMHARENLHRRVARVIAHKLLVDFENAFQLAVQNLPVDMCQVEIDHRLAVDAEVVLVDYFENRPRRHVARNQVAVLRIPLFEKIPTFVLRNRLRIACVARRLRHPHAPAFTARRLRHEPQFVFAWDAGGMHLNELAVGVVAPLLVERRLRRSRAHHGICRFAKDRAVAAGGNNDGVGRKRSHCHRTQVHGADAVAHVVVVKHCRKKFPVLVLVHLAFGFVAADLLVERV